MLSGYKVSVAIYLFKRMFSRPIWTEEKGIDLIIKTLQTVASPTELNASALERLPDLPFERTALYGHEGQRE